jgi:large subunit ribosomal protein L10
LAGNLDTLFLDDKFIRLDEQGTSSAPMSKYVKELMMNQLRSDLDGSRSLLILDLKGLDANAEHQFRRDLRQKSIRLRVLKNSLARRVFSEMGMDGLSTFLDGPSAIAWGGEGIAELAKEITARVKILKKPEIKGGAVDGVVVGREQVDDITKLPSREVLIGQVIGLLLGPARQTLSLLSSSSSTLVGQLEALVKRQHPGDAPEGGSGEAGRDAAPNPETV